MFITSKQRREKNHKYYITSSYAFSEPYSLSFGLNNHINLYIKSNFRKLLKFQKLFSGLIIALFLTHENWTVNGITRIPLTTR